MSSGNTDASERLRRTQALRDKTRSAIMGHHQRQEMVVPNVWGRLSLETYSRLRSHFEAVALLVEDGFPEEALELDRTMLSDSLLLMELELRPDDRMQLSFGYYNKSLNRKEALGKRAQAVGLSHGDEWETHVRMERRKLQEGQKHHGVGAVLRFESVSELARKHGRRQEDWEHHFLSEILHRVDIGQAFRSRVGPERNTLNLYLRNRDPSFLAAALGSAISSALYGHRAVASMLGWTRPSREDVDALLREIDSIFPDQSSEG